MEVWFQGTDLIPKLLVVKCSTTGLNYKMRQWTQAVLLHLRDGLQGGQLGTDWSNCEQRVYRFFLSFGGKTLSRSTGELNKAIRSGIPPSHHLITAASIFAASADNNCSSCCRRRIFFLLSWEQTTWGNIAWDWYLEVFWGKISFITEEGKLAEWVQINKTRIKKNSFKNTICSKQSTANKKGKQRQRINTTRTIKAIRMKIITGIK